MLVSVLVFLSHYGVLCNSCNVEFCYCVVLFTYIYFLFYKSVMPVLC